MLSSNSQLPLLVVPLGKTVEEIEQIVYGYGLFYAVDADNAVACLTSPRADEDSHTH